MPQLQDSAGSGRRLADGYRSTRNKLQGSKELFESIWPIFYPENFDRTLWPATWNHFFYEKSIINAEMQKKHILNDIMCIAPISYNGYISDIIICIYLNHSTLYPTKWVEQKSLRFVRWKEREIQGLSRHLQKSADPAGVERKNMSFGCAL